MRCGWLLSGGWRPQAVATFLLNSNGPRLSACVPRASGFVAAPPACAPSRSPRAPPGPAGFGFFPAVKLPVGVTPAVIPPSHHIT